MPYKRSGVISAVLVGASPSGKNARQWVQNARPSRKTGPGRNAIALANDTEPSSDGLIGLENDFTIANDGWVRISPYGDHIKERMTRQPDGTSRREVFVQRVDRAAAEAIVAKSKTLFGRIKRFFVGIPIFRGHPDLATHSPSTVTELANDGQSHGMFAELAAREDGLYGRPVVTPAGQAAIENEGLKFLSPFWWVKIVGEANGVPIVSPIELISAGLTRTPNIRGGEALANQGDAAASHTNQPKDMHLATLIALLALANDATEAKVTESIKTLKARADGIAALENEKTTATTAAQTATAEVTRLKTALANERQARVGLVLDRAIAEGRITDADRPAWQTALENEAAFEAKTAELLAKAKVLKTTSKTLDVGTRKLAISNEAERRTALQTLLDEKMRSGMDYTTAFNAVKSENPALFEAMIKPATA